MNVQRFLGWDLCASHGHTRATGEITGDEQDIGSSGSRRGAATGESRFKRAPYRHLCTALIQYITYLQASSLRPNHPDDVLLLCIPIACITYDLCLVLPNDDSCIEKHARQH